MSTRIYIDQVSNLKWTEVKGHRIKPKLPNGDYSPPPQGTQSWRMNPLISDLFAILCVKTLLFPNKIGSKAVKNY